MDKKVADLRERVCISDLIPEPRTRAAQKGQVTGPSGLPGELSGRTTTRLLLIRSESAELASFLHRNTGGFCVLLNSIRWYRLKPAVEWITYTLSESLLTRPTS